jgi:hypothetical protein
VLKWKVLEVLRITANLCSDPLVLKVEGKLRGPWVIELEHCWKSTCASYPGHRLRIELNDVTFVEDRGKVLLAEMLHRGAELVAVGPMMASILEEISAG